MAILERPAERPVVEEGGPGGHWGGKCRPRCAIEYGALLIGPDGRIEAAGPDAAVPRPADTETERFDDAILLPGLINTHTHLELTGLAEGRPAADFPAWIRRLRQRKAERSWDEVLAAARRGVADCWAAGVTTVADTGDSGAVIQALSTAGGSGIVYQEVFGPHPSSCTESLAGLQQQVEVAGRFATGRVRLGVSPHAPYTVTGPLYAATVDWARAQVAPRAPPNSVAPLTLVNVAARSIAPPPSPLEPNARQGSPELDTPPRSEVTADAERGP